MILKQGFHVHPKTVMLRQRGGSSAVEALQQIWLFAENARTWSFAGWTPEFVAAVGSIYGKPDLADLLVAVGFLDALPGGGFALHDFDQHNATLVQRWENGRFGRLGGRYGSLGGRPGNPRKTPGGGAEKPPVGVSETPGGGAEKPPDQTRPDQTSILQPSSTTAGEFTLSVEENSKANGKPAKAPRKRDPLYDALGELDGGSGLTRSAAGAVAKAKKEILAASPDVTPEEIRRRAGNLTALFPGAAVTASSLAKHWARCSTAPVPRLNGHGRPGGELAQVEAELRGMANPSMRELSDPAWQAQKEALERRRAKLTAKPAEVSR